MRAPSAPVPPDLPPPDAEGYYTLEQIPREMTYGHLYLPFKLTPEQDVFNKFGFCVCAVALSLALFFLIIQRRVTMTPSKMLVMCIIYGDLLSVSWAFSRHVSAAIFGYFAAGWWTCQIQGFIDGMWGIFAQMTFLGFTTERYISIVWQRDVTMKQMRLGVLAAGSGAIFAGILPFALQQNAGVMPAAVWCTPPWATGGWQGRLFSSMGTVAIGTVFLGISYMYWSIYITFARSAREARAAMQSDLNFSTMPSSDKRARLVPQPHPDIMGSPGGRRKGGDNELDYLDQCEAGDETRDTDGHMGRDSGMASDSIPPRAPDDSYFGYTDTLYAECDDDDDYKEHSPQTPTPPPRAASTPNKGKGRVGPRIIATASATASSNSPETMKSSSSADPSIKAAKFGQRPASTTVLNRSFNKLREGLSSSFDVLHGAFRRREQHDHMAPTRRLAVTLARQAFIIVTAYYVCLLPLFLCIVYNLISGIPVPPWADCTAYVAAVTYTALNPLLFMTLNKQFSQATRDEFASWRDEFESWREYFETRVLRR
ncbi:hypothetical protein HDU87_007654 [Geranomyces variabilis]|uniref:G-protein coupled receptors family 1 profile domain-containing protein n=1 Tax=Geranomyces variabilis TaxID=109894 RepID=A0AAD5XN76_9FUNG|nr:hypothetical protein HDU87_007654 [Geranomyces variabilis]